jgi:predicted phage terminase large subunit-like protein|tara:strand:+ start:111 stop:1649 length:1539 start_codon:yes stop_codon:yes gene_type:complete
MDTDLQPFPQILDTKFLVDQYVEQNAKQDFLTFVRLVAPTLISDWRMGRHIEVISNKLKQLEDGEIKRLMVFLPPRSSKSVICSKLFPAWYIGRNPEHEILTVSHSDQLSSDFGRSVRDIVSTEQFQNIFRGVSLRTDVRAAGKWKTNKGGTYYAAGVRSQIAGRGAHIAILDDVMSEEDSYSEAGRKYIKDWYPAGLRTRIMPNGSILIINTRYHYDDLCGWLLKQEENSEYETLEWEVIRIPAWLDEEAAELLELPEGSSYFPEWKSDEYLRIDESEIKASNGARYWNALYMQNPTPDEGGLIKKNWIRWWEYSEPPTCDFIIQTYDTAFSTKTTADYSVIQTWGIFSMFEEDELGVEGYQPHMILLGNMRGRYEYPELRRMAQILYDEFRPDVCMVEKKASGQSLIQDMRRGGLPVQEYTPDRDKVSRVYAASPMIETGKVWIPRNKPWADDLLTEMLQFPNAAHDDQVDAMTMAIHYMKESWHLTHPEDPDWDDDDKKNKKRVAYWRV